MVHPSSDLSFPMTSVDPALSRNLWVVAPSRGDADSFILFRHEVRAALDAFVPTRGLGLRFVLLDAVDPDNPDPAVRVFALQQDCGVIEIPSEEWRNGPGAALVYGLREIAPAGGDRDWIITVDADGQDAPEDFPHLLGILLESESTELGRRGVVVGRNIPRSLVYDGIFRLLTGSVPRNRHFAAFTFEGLRSWGWHAYFGASYAAALLKATPRVVEVRAVRRPRISGKSRMGGWSSLRETAMMLFPFHAEIAERGEKLSFWLLVAGLIAVVPADWGMPIFCIVLLAASVVVRIGVSALRRRARGLLSMPTGR